MIIKVKHARKSYTTVDNQVIDDPNLSAKAKGIWIYCMRLPDNWKFHLEELAEHFTDGIYSLREGFKELRENGYCSRKRVQRDWETVVYETKQFNKEREVSKKVKQNNSNTQIICKNAFGKVSSKGKRCVKIAFKYLQAQKNNWPHRVTLDAKSIKEGAQNIEKGHRIDGYLLNDIQHALNHVANDRNQFWNKNLYSLSTLRKKCRDGRTKLQHIMDEYEDKQEKNIEQAAPYIPEKLMKLAGNCPLHGDYNETLRLIEQLNNYYKLLPEKVNDLFQVGGCSHFIKRYWSFYEIRFGDKIPHCKNAGVDSKYFKQYIVLLENENGISFTSGRRK